MDNITIRFTDVSFDLDKLKLFLKTENARESFKPDGVILFARKVGKHKECWQFRLDTQNRNILCSGGPTKTFFGFNAWVSLNLPVQMKTLVGILSRKLEQIGGVKLSTKFGPAVHRVEITNLYRFKSLEEIAEAEIALYFSLVLRYPKNVMISGASMEVPGMIRVGLNKSSTTLRIYPEDLKFDARPKHISHERWRALCEELKFCLRVECIFDSTQLKAGDLDLTEKWNNLITKYLVPDMHGTKIGWVIVGGEAGHGARAMNPLWAESLLAQCEASGTPVLFKQWGDYLPEARFVSTEARGRRVAVFRADGTEIPMVRVGKKKAGRLFRQREWNGFPEGGTVSV